MWIVIGAIIINILIMLLVMLSLHDIRQRVVACGVALMMIADIQQRHEDEASKESNESGQVG